MEKINLREERDFGQKISDTFLFLQQNFGALFKPLLYYAGPVSLIAGVFMGLYQSNLLGLDAESIGRANDPFRLISQNLFNLNYIVTLALTVIGRIVVIGVTFAYLSAYLEKGGEPIGVAEVWQRFSRRFVQLFFTALLYLVGLAILSVLLTGLFTLLFFGTVPDADLLMERAFLVPLVVLLVFLPLIFIAVRAGLFCPVIFIEGKSGFAAYGRSWKLVKGKWWSTFGLLVVMSIIVSIIGVAFQLPLLLISIFKEILQWDNGRSFELIIMLASIIGMLGETLLFSILHISLGFQYFNLVERQESIGLMREIDPLGRQNEFDSHEGDY